MKANSDFDDEGKYDVREFECVGIYNLDNTQSSVAAIAQEIQSDFGFTVDYIDIENIDVNRFKGLPDKARLSLFQ